MAGLDLNRSVIISTDLPLTVVTFTPYIYK